MESGWYIPVVAEYIEHDEAVDADAAGGLGDLDGLALLAELGHYLNKKIKRIYRVVMLTYGRLYCSYSS